MDTEPPLSDQIRAAVDRSGMSRYAICKAIGMNQGAMSRFMNRRGGLSMEMLDRLGAVIGLSVSLTTNPGPRAEA
jgi:plasmid maintenance system antidote protein VapI